MSSPLDALDFPSDVSLPTANGDSIPVRGATRNARDLQCLDVDQRILIRSDGSTFSILRYYRPVVLDNLPEHYPLAVAQNEPDARLKRRFLTLSSGVIQLEKFPAAGDLFIPKNAWVREPKNYKDLSWIACEDAALAAEFQRRLFGGTLAEIEAVALAFERVTRGTGALKKGAAVRITMSKKQEHPCALSGAFIPEGFPFLLFEGITFSTGFGRVSLSGFYRQLTLVCRGYDERGAKGGSDMFARMVEAGADSAVLARLCEIGRTMSGKAVLYWLGFQWPTRA